MQPYTDSNSLYLSLASKPTDGAWKYSQISVVYYCHLSPLRAEKAFCFLVAYWGVFSARYFAFHSVDII